MELSTISPSLPSSAAGGATGGDFGALGSQEFFQLIITDLLNQDPLQPTDNQKLLEQIALIRDIEMNNEVSTTMRSLMDQQRFGSAATLIGQFVEGGTADGLASGMVAGVRFDDHGNPFLMLDSGRELPLSSLQTVTSVEQSAQALVGQLVTAEITEDGEPQTIEGVVTEVKVQSGNVLLELDTGLQVPLASVKDQRSPS